MSTPRFAALRATLLAFAVVWISAGPSHSAPSPTDWEGTRPIVPAWRAPALLEEPTTPSALAPGLLADPAAGTWTRIAPPLGVGSYRPDVVFDPVGNRLIVLY